jgi:hypothetical protein
MQGFPSSDKKLIFSPAANLADDSRPDGPPNLQLLPHETPRFDAPRCIAKLAPLAALTVPHHRGNPSSNGPSSRCRACGRGCMSWGTIVDADWTTTNSSRATPPVPTKCLSALGANLSARPSAELATGLSLSYLTQPPAQRGQRGVHRGLSFAMPTVRLDRVPL